MYKKVSLMLALLVAMALVLVACGDPTATTVAPTAAATTAASATTAKPATTAAPAATTAAATTAAPAATTAAVATTAAIATTAAPAATTAAIATTAPAAATTASGTTGGAGVVVDVNGTKVTVKPGGGAKYEPKSPVTIKFWHSQSKDNAKALKSLVDEFTAKNPNIKVEVDNGNDTYTYDTINDKVTQGATTGQLPNVVTGYENWVPAFVDAKVALPLNQFISGQYGLNQAQLEDYYPQMLARGIFPQYANETYTWVFANSAPVMYYNKDMLDKYGVKVPETWDDLVAASKTIFDKSNKEAAGFVFKIANPVSELWAAPVYARGGQFYDYANKKFIFTDKASTDQLNMIYDGVKNGYFITSDPNVNNQDQTLFEQGKAAFYISSTSSRSYIAADIAKGGPGITKFNFNGTVIPHGTGMKPVTTLYGGAALGFKGKTPEEDAASWEFMKYLGSADFQGKWATLSGYVPATKSSLENADYKAFLEKAPENKIPLSVLQYGTAAEPKIGQWQAGRKVVNDALFALFQNPNGDVNAILKKMEDDANKLLK